MDFIFFKIDKDDPNLPSLAQKYKALRLSALKQSPAAFSSTYETESQFSDDVWISRLRSPVKETFICATQAGDWTAQVTLLGPVPAEAFRLPEEAAQPNVAPDDDEEKWQMLSLYTLPDYRGKSLGKRLCRETFAYLQSLGRAPSKVLVRIMVKAENTVTVKLYESLGFSHAGACTLEEALRANGDSEWIPQGTLPETYTVRRGIIMTITLKR